MDVCTKNFGLIDFEKGEILGIAMTNLVISKQHSSLLSELIESLGSQYARKTRCWPFEGYRRLQLELPMEPFMVTTIVIEKNDGVLVPVMNRKN